MFMKRTYSISEIREKITHLPEQLEQEQEKSVTVTRRGQPVLAILPFEFYQQLLEKMEALEETLEIMQDEEFMQAFREGVSALERGELVTWENAKRELGLA